MVSSTRMQYMKRKGQTSWEEVDRQIKPKGSPALAAIREAAGNKKVKST